MTKSLGQNNFKRFSASYGTQTESEPIWRDQGRALEQ